MVGLAVAFRKTLSSNWDSNLLPAAMLSLLTAALMIMGLGHAAAAASTSGLEAVPRLRGTLVACHHR